MGYGLRIGGGVALQPTEADSLCIRNPARAGGLSLRNIGVGVGGHECYV